MKGRAASHAADRQSAADHGSSTDKSFGLLRADQRTRLVTCFSACFGAGRSLDECIGLISPVEMSLENTTGIIRFERLAVEVNRSDPLR